MSLERASYSRLRMRTLVDLLNDERGYVRIFAERTGFGYEKSPHAPTPFRDLFDRMTGYESMGSALEAAQLQLRADTATARRRTTRVRAARHRG